MNLVILIAVVGAILFVKWLSSWWTVVPVSEAHIVATPKGKIVVASDEKIGDCKSYFNIPHFIPLIGRVRRIISIEIQEIVIPNLETYEKQQARFAVTASTKYRVRDVKTAAETFTKKEQLETQLKEVIESSVRVVTIKHDVNEARAKKKEIEDEIKLEMEDDFGKWGLELISFQLVDFKDTTESKIISNISTRREADIEANTRIEVAEKKKQARIKEAEADELATKREVEAEQQIEIKKQEKEKAIQETMKNTEEKRLEVVKVQTIKQQEIDKEQAIIKAEESKATTEILKEQKRLEGEGERLRLEEIAKGQAASKREELIAEAEGRKQMLLAEAQGKEKLQEALSKFDENAIRAMVAQDIVEKDKAIGTEVARSLSKADVKVFAGDDKQGFDLGKLISGMKVADSTTADSVLNRLARPFDLGININAARSITDEDINNAIEKATNNAKVSVDTDVIRNIVLQVLQQAASSEELK